MTVTLETDEPSEQSAWDVPKVRGCLLYRSAFPKRLVRRADLPSLQE